MFNPFVLSAFLLLTPPQDDKGRVDLPISAPTGWESVRQDTGITMSPKDAGEGHAYVVLVPALSKSVGSVRGLLDLAKATLSSLGEFKAGTDPAAGKTDPGWEFEVVVGTLLRKDGKTLISQGMGLRKGDKEGIVLVIADGVETMQKYADHFKAMIHLMDAPVPKPAPPAAAGAADLVFKAPEGWMTTPQKGNVMLSWSNDKTRGQFDIPSNYRLLIFPSQPLKGTIRKTFLDYWTAEIKGAFETSIMPIPLIRRLKSGALCAFDVDNDAKTKEGQGFAAGLYMLAQGKRVVPIIAIFVNRGRDIDAPLLAFMESARIPDAGDDKIVPYTAADLAGVWVESSISLASYVSNGQVVGDASLATGSTLTYNADGTFKSWFFAVGQGTRLRISDNGTWTVDDVYVVTKGKEKTDRLMIYGAGADPKAGAFLVTATYANDDKALDLGFPRGAFQSTWYKKKP